ncbi:hypothetical protein SUGI_1097600 [Cryptomeria japonica]|nr:hypothetical protein SUGI_1097600 [Cryptomeria japonica]
MAEFAILMADEYCRKRDLQESNADKELICSQTVALMRHLKQGVKASTVKFVWEVQKTVRHGDSLILGFVEGIFSA